MFEQTVFQDNNFLSDFGSWSIVSHFFLLLTSHSLTNRVAQSTDVISATLFSGRTSKGLSRVLQCVIMTYFLKKQQNKHQRRKMSKNHDKENMDTKMWIATESQEQHVCM